MYEKRPLPYQGLTTLNSSETLFHAYLPVRDHVVKKNSKVIGYRRTNRGRISPFIRSSSKQISAQSSMVLDLQRYARNSIYHELLTKPIDSPVWIVLHFFYCNERYYTKKGIRTLKLPDLSNLYELPQDALTKANIISDDKIIRSHDLSRILPWHENALEIWIMPYREQQDLELLALRQEYIESGVK